MRSLFPTLRKQRADTQPKETQAEKELIAPNPHRNPRVRAGYFSTDVDRLLQGWDTASQTVDYYLQTQLRPLRARSRDAVRGNPFGKRFVQTIKSNVVGPNGVAVQAQSMFRGEPDKAANDAIESGFAKWCQHGCDYLGRHSFIDLQNLLVGCAAQDGEFIVRKHYDRSKGLQLQIMDPELLDVEKNQLDRKGNEVRLGVEYDVEGRVVRYHFKKKTHPVSGGYDNYQHFSLPASAVIHGYICEWPDQSRGVPWMHSALERSKHLDKYDEAAIVNARSNAAAMGFLRSNGEDQYEGDEQWGDDTLDQFEAGTIKDIGDREFTYFHGHYPHQMYGQFVKRQLQSIASGLGISYHSLSGDLEGVNYSSIRAGVLEDREIFKGLQNWFIRCFVQPVYEEWLAIEHAAGRLRVFPRGGGESVPLRRPVEEYMPAHFQGRRWAWVDPAKDGYANQMAIHQRLKSRSQIIREQGDDPEEVFKACAQDEAKLAELGLTVVEIEEPPHGQET